MILKLDLDKQGAILKYLVVIFNILEAEENKLLLSGFLTHAADFFGAIK